MNQVTVSSKYQVVIPLDVRRQMKIRAGQKMLVVPHGNTIELIPDRNILEMRGAFPDLTTSGFREEVDRL